MAATIDELTVNWENEQGQLTTRELDKKVLSKGSWVTIMFLYQDLDGKTGDFGPEKVRIQRYQKRNDRYVPQSKFNISSEKQAKMIVDILNEWYTAENGGE